MFVADVSTPSSKRNFCNWVSCEGLLSRFIPPLQFDFNCTEDYVTTSPRLCCPCILFQQYLATLVNVWFKVLFRTKLFTFLLVLSNGVTRRLYTFISWWCHPFGSAVLFAAKHPLIAAIHVHNFKTTADRTYIDKRTYLSDPLAYCAWTFCTWNLIIFCLISYFQHVFCFPWDDHLSSMNWTGLYQCVTPSWPHFMYSYTVFPYP